MTRFATAFRTATVVLAVLCCTLLLAPANSSAKFPEKNITMVIPYPPGGNMDMSSRPLAAKLSEILGVKVIVQQVPGAAALTGSLKAITSKPDGYTILYGVHSVFSARPYLQPGSRISIDMAEPIAGGAAPMILFGVNKASPINSLEDFVKACKANPGKISVGQVGRMGTMEILNGQMSQVLDIKVKRVPFDGGGPLLAALMGNHLDAGFNDTYNPDFKALAVINTERGKYYPELKTMAELGYPEMDIFTYYCFFAPKGTPADVIKVLEGAIEKAIKDPEFVQFCEKTRMLPIFKTSKQLGELIAHDTAIIKNLIAKNVLIPIK
ncbi:tripartite tricarboxylate transporter substrate binding protein [Desulfovibrio sp. OttesenSCG-928-O18]|nr:tripartite tricarboxylate transporter substrate binding protein [Desulfovibrio sp. OttesenSCG-928-O18]